MLSCVVRRVSVVMWTDDCWSVLLQYQTDRTFAECPWDQFTAITFEGKKMIE